MYCTRLLVLVLMSFSNLTCMQQQLSLSEQISRHYIVQCLLEKKGPEYNGTLKVDDLFIKKEQLGKQIYFFVTTQKDLYTDPSFLEEPTFGEKIISQLLNNEQLHAFNVPRYGKRIRFKESIKEIVDENQNFHLVKEVVCLIFFK